MNPAIAVNDIWLNPLGDRGVILQLDDSGDRFRALWQGDGYLKPIWYGRRSLADMTFVERPVKA